MTDSKLTAASTPEPPAAPAAGHWVRTMLPPPFLFAIFFFGMLFWLDFPKPFIDDMYYVGAGINLANGGDFSNPLVARQATASAHHFFGHPPLYSYVLAVWLKLSGISTRSLEFFQMVMYLVICRATMAILRKYDAARLLEWFVPLATTSAFMGIGFRFESFSIALTMAGFAIISCGRNGWSSIFFGFLLIFLGASAASRVTFFSGALAALAFFNLWRNGVSHKKLVLPLCALLIAWFAFLVMINFHLEEFWKNYLFVASGRTGGSRFQSLGYFLFHIQGVTWLPVMLLWFCSLPLMFRFRDRDLSRIALFASVPIFMLAALAALNHGTIWYVMFILLVVVAAWSKQLPPARARALQLVLAAALLMANFRYGLGLVGMALGEVKYRPPANLAELQAFRPGPGQYVLINSETARYVFDFRIPPGFGDWNFATVYPGSLATESAPHPGDVYLVGPAIVSRLNQDTSLNMPPPMWKPFGSDRWASAKSPENAYLIDPNHGLKTSATNRP